MAKRTTLPLCLTLFLSPLLVGSFTAAASAQDKVTYDDHVQRILLQRCGKCHGEERQKAGLNVSSYSTLMAGSSGGVVLEPGSPDESNLFLAITHRREPTMPPGNGKIPDADIEVIRKWIAGGLLENGGSQAKARKKKSSVDLSAVVTSGRPVEPPPLPRDLLLEPAIVSARPGAIESLAANPWSPLVAVGGQHQVLLYRPGATQTGTAQTGQTSAGNAAIELIGILPFPEGVPHALQFSRDGRLLLAAGGRGAALGRAVVWNVEDGERVIEVGNESDAILAADLSADRSQVAIGTSDKVVKVLASESGKTRFTLKKHTDWVTAVAFSPDGVLLASGDRAGNLVVWEAPTGREMHTLAGHTGAITGLAWRDDGNVLASTSEDGTVRLWEMFEGKLVKSFGAHGGGALAVAMAHDGRLVTGGRDKAVKLWSAEGQLLKQFDGLGDVVLNVAIGEDGGQVIGGDWLGTVRVWNVADGKVAGELPLNPPTVATQLARATERIGATKSAAEQATAARAALEEQAKEPIARRDTARALADAATRKAAELEQALAAIPVVAPEALLSGEQRTLRETALNERRALQAKLAETAASVRAAANANPGDAELEAAAAAAESAASHAGQAASAIDAALAAAAKADADAKQRAETSVALETARAELAGKRGEAEARNAEAAPLAKALETAVSAEQIARVPFEQAQHELAKWQAAAANLEVDRARRELAKVEDELAATSSVAAAAEAEAKQESEATALLELALATAPARLAEHDATIAAARGSVDSALAALVAEQAEASDRAAPVAALEATRAAIAERVAKAPGDAALAASLKSIEQGLADLRASIAAADSRVAERRAAVEAAKAQVVAREQARADELAKIAALPRQIEETRAAVLALAPKSAATQAALAAATKALDEQRATVDRLTQRYRELAAAVESSTAPAAAAGATKSSP